MTAPLFKGVITALITPLRDGNVDEDAFVGLLERQIAAGVHGVVPMGTTGESATLSAEEHKRVVELCVKTAAGRVRVVAGAGASATDKAIDLARHAKTHEARVFKFSLAGKGLTSLKREVTVARLLREALGEREDFVRVLDWDFEQAPYFIESEYGGVSLDRWPASGGIAAISRDSSPSCRRGQPRPLPFRASFLSNTASL